MSPRRASCCCGRLAVVCNGEPVRVSICHCLACQQRTGSAFGVQARFRREQVAIVGQALDYVRAGDEGPGARFRFCPACGSTVYWEMVGVEDVLVVAVGAFADPTFSPPSVSVYEVRRHAWVAVPVSVTEHWD